jgi:EAL domain-containing protein (putative c-di-GMP-specific phosphodiesterase class I)
VNALEEIGCRFVQGFYFSKPVSNPQFRTLATQTQWNVTRSEPPVERIAGARR